MRKLLLLLSLALPTAIWADPDFSEEKKYHIVCAEFSGGCVADGASVAQSTPVYYLPSATTAEETYWQIVDEGGGYFSIKNLKTGQYITYDGQRQDTPQLLRYVTMTNTKDGNNSLWTFVSHSDGVYAIRNAGQPDHLWDVRRDSYCVGTYSNNGTPSTNQQFSIYDAQGNRVTEKQETVPAPEDMFNVSSWLVATTESPDGWTFLTDAWTDPGFGQYRNGTASVVSPFLERWNDSAYGPLPDNDLGQTLSNLPQGSYELAADVIAVLQASNSWWGSSSEEVGRGVYLYGNEQQTECGTRNERPQHYTTTFTVKSDGEAMIGLSISGTNANWVAVDNFALYYKGTQEELIAGEKAKVRAELQDYFDAATLDDLIDDCNDDFAALEELRHSADNLPTIDPLAQGARDLAIDGQGLAWVESLELYLVSIPESHFKTDYTAVIDYELVEGWDTLKINGKYIAPGDSYTFSRVTAGKTYSFTAAKKDGSTRNVKRVTFTSLPVVRLYGSFSNNYSDGRIQVMETDLGYIPDLLNMKAKWRGGITNGNDKHKRNYHVKLKNELGDKLEQSFFGLRNDNSWILESCQVDMSRIRNRVLTDLWNDFSTPPYYIDKDDRAMTGTRGQFVELILNDEYRGIYCMTENMDRKQLKLKKIDETAASDYIEEATHGQLWKAKDWSYAVFMGPNRGDYYPADYLTTPNPNNSMWDKYEVKYPDFEDYGYVTDWSTLYDAVDFVCNSDDDTFREEVAEYFDIPVFMDYYILMETILATDNHGKNQFFAVYDKQEDKKITFAVWDMDATCGQRWSDQYYHWDGMKPEQDYARYIYNNEHGENNLYKRLRDTDADDFNMKMRLRYRDLRKNWLATDKILSRFSTYLEQFKLCGAAQREYNRWNGDSDIAGHTLNFDTEMDYLTDWFTRRMNYLDTTRFDIASLPSDEPLKGDVNGDGTVDVADVSAIIDVMAGATIPDASAATSPDASAATIPDASASGPADVNGDGTVDVADISTVITIMATQPQPLSRVGL